jgi:Uma2 family endonuclease
METIVKKKNTIPTALIYEIMDGKPIYYRGYKEVLSKEKSIEEIIGSGLIQSLIASILNGFLSGNISIKKGYYLLTNESGLHFDRKNNLSADVALVRRDLVKDIWSVKYLDVAPTLVIEIDTKADIENFGSEQDYFFIKTQKMLDFGVEKVVWIMVQSRKMLVATSVLPWTIVNWDTDIALIENVSMNLNSLLKEEGIL